MSAHTNQNPASKPQLARGQAAAVTTCTGTAGGSGLEHMGSFMFVAMTLRQNHGDDEENSHHSS